MNLRLLQRSFVAGLLTLFPIWLTWIVFKFVFQGLSMVSTPWIKAVSDPLARTYPPIFGWLASPTTQFLLGVLTIVWQVPIVLGVLHQFGAVLLLCTVLNVMHKTGRTITSTPA